MLFKTFGLTPIHSGLEYVTMTYDFKGQSISSFVDLKAKSLDKRNLHFLGNIVDSECTCFLLFSTGISDDTVPCSYFASGKKLTSKGITNTISTLSLGHKGLSEQIQLLALVLLFLLHNDTYFDTKKLHLLPRDGLALRIVRGQFLISPGLNLDPSWECSPLRSPPGVNTLFSLK
jgi:hypothetical protein